ncbi:uncharacterized protein CIMG_03651 [Coccidioides immitis RS]|uniref:Uncharacterized protein n=3 Tax=Coccidioides immitis TaxID=5501 RepID=J3KBU9_COCIM|nr:uncharacterized protein CIMG_03651 [Coccidioides immitis RS]EAS32627.3 hypothetical protein CIMG_03651 [Coccidioides immitis RS]KMP07875.1 hypothetical protein CIRG_07556 [Coccidioides immitis RMSCC 2394]KMU85061.1 hypothetical protein CIHG_02843 [Coccidioides immitis H538.4]TPX19663.1 hypothetical protein DIZ76_017455 [Coccidioides immitis]
MSAEAVNGGPVAQPVPDRDAQENKEATPQPEKPIEVNGDAAQPEEKEKATEGEKAIGEKREHDESGTAKEGKATSEGPPEKKQKVETEKQPDGEAKPASPNRENVDAANGMKKRGPGRPKKGEAKKQQKTPTPRSTDGIGSRTRSRTKA